jgi:hypothetical protein
VGGSTAEERAQAPSDPRVVPLPIASNGPRGRNGSEGELKGSVLPSPRDGPQSAPSVAPALFSMVRHGMGFFELDTIAADANGVLRLSPQCMTLDELEGAINALQTSLTC